MTNKLIACTRAQPGAVSFARIKQTLIIAKGWGEGQHILLILRGEITICMKGGGRDRKPHQRLVARPCS